ncbi:threonine aldolase family protein [soil metagenome]
MTEAGIPAARSAAPITIDLVSDTATRPTAAMRRAIAEAEVGDEQRGEDPTVNALNARVAKLLGQEAAIFLPSGTMCNQIAIAVHCSPGDEIIAASNAHIIASEGSGAAVFAGSTIRPIATNSGVFGADDVAAAIRAPRVKSPRSRLVAVEQTSNRGGGSIWPVATIDAVADVAVANGLRLHMDGARLLNACVAAGVEAKRYAQRFDSVWLDLSKGLGCPVGGVLAGSAEFIAEADRWKHRFGGAMRQAGILAAAGIHALDHHVTRLVEDHRHAALFARHLAKLPGVRLSFGPVQTNLVFFDVEASGQSAQQIAARLQTRGLRIGVEGRHQMRAVFHLDVDEPAVLRAVDILSEALDHPPNRSGLTLRS